MEDSTVLRQFLDQLRGYLQPLVGHSRPEHVNRQMVEALNKAVDDSRTFLGENIAITRLVASIMSPQVLAGTAPLTAADALDIVELLLASVPKQVGMA